MFSLQLIVFSRGPNPFIPLLLLLLSISDTVAMSLDDKFESLESILAEHLPADVLEKVNLSLRGPGSR